MDSETIGLWRKTLITLGVVLALAALVLIVVLAIDGDSFLLSDSGETGTTGPASDSSQDELLITVFDVGQAQAVGVISPTGEAMLIDASRSQQRVEEYIVPYLEDNGVDDLEYLIVSHPDQDHIGGMPRVLELLDVETYVDPVIPTTNQTYAETLELVIDLEIEAIEARRGLEFDLGPDVQATVLWPVEPLLESGGELDSNENSIVLVLEYGDTSILIPGDAGSDAEDRLIQLDANEDLQSEILIVGHHGSNTSSSGAFLDAVSPEAAVISAGFDNQFGHPTDEVIQRLRIRGIDIYRTDLDGTIELRSDGEDHTIEMLGTDATP